MKGINNALETKPGTSLDTVTSLSHAIANPRARDKVSSDVCNAEISSTNFCSCNQCSVRRPGKIHTHHHRNGVEKMKSCPDWSFDEFRSSSDLPITRPALLFPNADAADSPCGTAEEAILVIEIEDVFVAKMVSGLVSAANSENIRRFTSRFSETALGHTLR